jgi:transposase-like protein
MTLALMIAHGVNSNGTGEILAVEPMFDESEDSWRAFFRKLKKRGLRRVNLCISDAHAGIQAAVNKELLGASWQRCKVHFMRNILAKDWPADRSNIKREKVQEALERGRAFLAAQAASRREYRNGPKAANST